MSDYHEGLEEGIKVGKAEADARIAELEAALATARREGMEHVRTLILRYQNDQGLRWREYRAVGEILEIVRKEIDAVRAVLKGGEDD